jgi:hypothetical protein
MRREEAKTKWTPQQMVYISQLHLTTVMLLTGKIRLVEKDGDKEVVVEGGEDESKKPAQTCSDEQRSKVKEMITAYVAAGPQAPQKAAAPAAGAAPAPAAAATTTGSTAAPAAKQPAAAAAAAPAPVQKK